MSELQAPDHDGLPGHPQYRRYSRPNCGVGLVALLDPGGLDRLQDPLRSNGPDVPQSRAIPSPSDEVGEVQVDVVDVGVAFTELNRDIVNIRPAFPAIAPSSRPSCCGWPPAAAKVTVCSLMIVWQSPATDHVDRHQRQDAALSCPFIFFPELRQSQLSKAANRTQRLEQHLASWSRQASPPGSAPGMRT